MSGLSARTYSCGGDGDRLRGGCEGPGAGCPDSFGKNLSSPGLALGGAATVSLSSSSLSEGAGDSDDKDERSEESSSGAMLGMFEREATWYVEKGKGTKVTYASGSCSTTTQCMH